MIALARVAAKEILQRVELQQEHSDDALHGAAMAGLEPRDRSLATEIVYGTLRWRIWLDYILEQTVARAWEEVDPRIKIILRLSLYQISRMDRVPDHAVIHDAVEMAKQQVRQAAGAFVNGVLRTLARRRPWKMRDFHRDCPEWIRVSLPRWLWERWAARFGTDHACEYALSLNRQPRLALRACQDIGGMRASELVPGAFFLDEEKPAADAKGLRFQDEASQLIPFLLGALDGNIIWDACAAPGGKSAVLLEQCGPGGRVISSDLDWRRARRLRTVLANDAGNRFETLVADAGKPSPFRMQFDAVLADVPCSGLGTLRRNPEIKWRFREEWLQVMRRKQGAILDAVAQAVRPGGKLLYSTCSTEPEENEDVIDGFLNSHPEFRIAQPDFPKGIEAWLDEAGIFRSFPGARLWDGFFAALMVRGQVP